MKVFLYLIKIFQSFQKINKFFWCGRNKLISLKGSPKEVGGDFICHSNQLTSLQYAPEKVSDNFDCSNNILTSLEGCPKEVGGKFWCSNNKLTSLKGIEKVGDKIFCGANPLNILELLDMDMDFNKLMLNYFEKSWLEWLDKTAVGTNEEKMLFKLKYL